MSLVNELNILHYPKYDLVDEASIDDHLSAVVILSDGDDNKHTQIKVAPFNSSNVDKQLLSFKDRVQYYKKVVRGKRGAAVETTSENVSVVTALITNYFDAADGFDDEYAEYLDGLQNKPITGYESNPIVFFEDHFLNLPEDELNKFNIGLYGV